MSESLKVVELFCGIGGFRIAADKLGLKTIWANDIDEKAASVYKSRLGNEVKEGDIWGLIKEIPKHDILTGGFPCQPFSSAGKKLGVRDARGTLFEAIVSIIQINKPRYFALENVKRLLHMEQGRHFSAILAALNNLGYQVEWRLVNASELGLAQNRERVIIVGKKESDDLTVHLANKDDLEIKTSKAIDATWTSISTRKGTKYKSWGVCRKSKFITRDLCHFSDSKPRILIDSILERKVDPQFDFTESTIKRIGESKLVGKLIDGVEVLSNQRGGARMGYTVFGTKGLSPTLTASTSRHYERYKIGDKFRRLTNVEYARLQGFPDDHCAGITVYDQYQLYGNAIPPQMAEWALTKITRKGANIKIVSQGDLFPAKIDE